MQADEDVQNTRSKVSGASLLHPNGQSTGKGSNVRPSKSTNVTHPKGKPIRTLADHVKLPPEDYPSAQGVERFRFDPEEFELVKDESLIEEERRAELNVTTDSVLKGVIERRTESSPVAPSFPSLSKGPTSLQGFPKALHRSHLGKRTATSPLVQSAVTLDIHDEIGKENDKIISQMTEAEIVQAQQEILQAFDHETIERFKTMSKVRHERTKVQAEGHDQVTFLAAQTPSSDVTDNSQDTNVIDDTLPDIMHEKYFPNLPKDEDKLEWMGYSKAPTPTTNSSKQRFRFDFSGHILDPSTSLGLPGHLGLHHHGDNPDEAGYTIQELLHLSSSSSPPQRVFSMGVISRIVQKLKIGELPKLVVNEVQQALNASGWIIIVRTALDDPNANVVTAGIFAIWTMLCDGEKPYEDRSSFHREVAENHDFTKVQDLHDVEHAIHVASSDWIRALMEMDILKRIKVLLCTCDLTRLNVAYLLNILCKLVDCSEAGKMLFDCNGLLDAVWNMSIRKPWPPENHGNDVALPTGIALAQKLVKTSIDNARLLVRNGYIDDLVRFISVEPGELDSDSIFGNVAHECIKQTIFVFANLTAYGLWFERLSDHLSWLSAAFKFYSILDREICIQVTESLLHLTSNFVKSSVDPHRTEPPHSLTKHAPDILMQTIFDMFQSIDFEKLDDRVVSCALSLINDITQLPNGEKLIPDQLVSLIKTSFSSTGLYFRLENDIMNSLTATTDLNLVNENVNVPGIFAKENRLVEEGLVKINTSIRYFRALSELGTTFLSNDTIPFLNESISNLVKVILSWKLWERIKTSRVSVLIPEMSALLIRFVSNCNEFETLVRVLSRLSIGFEYAACKLIDRILSHEKLQSPFITGDRLLVTLQKFYHFASTSGSADILMRSLALENGDGRKLYSQFFKLGNSESRVGLPLPNDWVFQPLYDLLNSGKTEIWDELGESGRQMSEVEIVLGTLIIAKASYRVLEDVIYPLMQVMMLEKDQQHPDAFDTGNEVFRDPRIMQVMSDILDLTCDPSFDKKQSVEEQMAPGRFAAFYEEFVALYSSISFSHSLFSRLLLPPLQMADFSPDCRFTLLSDHGAILPTIRIPVVIENGMEISAKSVPFFGLSTYLPPSLDMWKWLDGRHATDHDEDMLVSKDHYCQKEEAVILTIVKELVIGKRIRKEIKNQQGWNFLYYWGIGILSRLVFDEWDTDSKKRLGIAKRVVKSVLNHGSDQIIRDWIEFGRKENEDRWTRLLELCEEQNHNLAYEVQRRITP